MTTQTVLCVHGFADYRSCPDCKAAMASLNAQAHRARGQEEARTKSNRVAPPAPRVPFQPPRPETIAKARAIAQAVTAASIERGRRERAEHARRQAHEWRRYFVAAQGLNEGV